MKHNPIKYKVTNIKWDCDENLDTEMVIFVPFDEADPEEYITDALSDITGYLHNGYNFELA